MHTRPAIWRTCFFAGVGAYLLGLAPAFAESDEKTAVFTIGDVQIQRIHHDDNLLPDREHAGLSSLLYDAEGELVLHDDGKTWLYTTGLFDAPTGGKRDWYGKWISHVREFNPKTLVSGEKKPVLGLAENDQWAVIHDVMKVSDDLYVALYSTNGGVRAAVSDRPNGMFEADPDFQITVTDEWEDEGGEKDSLESVGGHVKIAETDEELTFWLMYDSYHVDQTAGQLGWAKVRVDKETGDIELLGKHPGNPLPLLPEGYIAARALSLSHNPAGQANRSPVLCGHGCRNSQLGGAGGLGDGLSRPAGAAAPAPRAGAHRVRGG